MMLIVQFLLAHLIADFFLQPRSWVHEKETKKLGAPLFYAHILLHFILMLLITGLANNYDFGKFLIPAALVTLAHLLIDAAKLYFQKPNNRRAWFFADQILHVISIITVCFFYTSMQFDPTILQNKQFVVYLFAFLFVLKPASIIIKMLIARWTPPTLSGIVHNKQIISEKESLENAGEWIGMLERSLVLIFILIGHWEAVGFLLAAKSVFRFGDIKASREMKLTEYVLIGTLLSFGIAMVAGIIAMQL